MRILFIADTPFWVFARMGKALQTYGKNEYVIRYGRRSKYRKVFHDANNFDLVIFAVDVRIDRVIREDKSLVPPNKLIVLIRSDVFRICRSSRLHYYKQKGLMAKKVKAFMCANQKMYEKFKTYGNLCYYAPGGVDTDIFRPRKRRRAEKCRVGWAGSIARGRDIRGLPAIKRACIKGGFKWNPAIKENKSRIQTEMVRYYNNEIDVYVDASITAGRQNGLLEAAACGTPIACTRVGIGGELIDKGLAVEIQRNARSIKSAIIELAQYRGEIDWHLVKNIRNKWSWRHHTKLWEEMFREIKTSK